MCRNLGWIFLVDGDGSDNELGLHKVFTLLGRYLP